MDGNLQIGRTTAAPQQRLRLLGGEIDLVTPDEVLDFTAERIAAGGKAVVANHNLHSLYLMRGSAAMRRLYAMADLIEADSTPLIAWGRALGWPISRRHRCTYLDWRDAFWRRAATAGWRIFYLGGAPGVAEKAARTLREIHPGVEVCVRDGYFDATSASQNAGVVAAIRGFAPDVLFVGMGMPRQEEWIADNIGQIERGVIFPVGAAFDYEAGAQRAAPRWSGALGLEWLFRFAGDPVRLFGRYFVEPWSLIGPAIVDLRARRRAAAAR